MVQLGEMMTQAISLRTKVSVSDSMLSSNLGDEVVMMCIEQGKYYSLKGPSFRIWELLESPIAVSDIHETLINEYDIAPGECAEQLLAMIEQMREKKMVVCCN